MKLISLYSWLLLLVLIIPVECFAQVYNCDGNWTNVPCDQERTPRKKKPSAAPNNKRSNSSQKKSLFHELNMKNIRAKREHGIRLNISRAEKVCLSPDSLLEECEDVINRYDGMLDERISRKEESRKSSEEEDSSSQEGEKKNSGGVPDIRIDQKGTDIQVDVRE